MQRYHTILTFDRFKKLFYATMKKARENEYALIVLNIRNFSSINTCFGVQAGNDLLEYIDKIFAKNNTPPDLISRVYADTYIIFCKNAPYFALEDKIAKLTLKIKDLNKVIQEQKCDYKVEFSSGVCYIENTQQSVYSTIRKADKARKGMLGRYLTNRLSQWTPQMEALDKWVKDITACMNGALEKGEFLVYYQPKFSFETGKIVGAEALVRWNYSGKGIIGPNNFISIFEDNGFIFKIDTMIFEKVCQFLVQWNNITKSMGATPFPITVSFNLSRNNLSNQDIPKILSDTLKKYDIQPSKIEVEVTESFMAKNQDLMLKRIADLSNIGFPISIDDFGAGYSSLNVLKDMKADIIKLDKEFLSGNLGAKKNFVIVQSMIDMAKKLGIKTVAEGVETKEQADILKSMGCDIVQGFLYARPMPEAEFVCLLKNQMVQEKQDA